MKVSDASTGFVTLGAQYGDKAAGDALEASRLAVRKVLLEHFSKDYCRELSEMSLIMRVDGAIWHWELSGVHRVRLQRKQRYVTACDVWGGKDLLGHRFERGSDPLASMSAVYFDAGWAGMRQRSPSNG